MTTCLIGLGANLGDRRRALDRAVELLEQRDDVRVLARSRWHETAPVGGPVGQEPFLNGAVVLTTRLEPEALLAVLRRIESALGRRRAVRWGPRALDLDLLIYGDLIRRTPSLTLPHPRMAWRRFVLEPAAEVAAEMMHPTTGWTIAQLLEHLNTAVPYVALAGPVGVGKTRLADELAESTGATRIDDRPPPGGLEAFSADPPGNAWGAAIEFLESRARLLDAESPGWSQPGRLWVSDFWFAECLALAEVWLASEPRDAYRRRWEAARRTVVAPKLTVVLDAPAERLLDRLREQGRRPGSGLSLEMLDRFRRAILDESARPGQGPVLRLACEDSPLVREEVLAAVEAMG
ncbi:MAG: 2-amino-4-hydroxy-6-hydroxymethyldihydropteridine diphosphokinase [Pirellulales bacterium]